AAGAGEEVGVGDAVAFQGVGQGAGDGFLADEVGEGLRPVAPRQDGVAFGGWRGFGGRRGGFLRHCPWPAVSKDRAAAWRRERIFHCTRVHAYGCTFRPDQVHTSPLRGSPHGASTRPGGNESGTALDGLLRYYSATSCPPSRSVRRCG